MIGLDTNVLVRATVDEADEDHTRAARSLFGGRAGDREPVYLNTVVLVESVWMLRRFGKLDREHIADFIDGLPRAAHVVLSDREAVAEAVDLYRAGGADFADVLIGLLNKAAGCRTTFTFDRQAARLTEFSPVLDD